MLSDTSLLLSALIQPATKSDISQQDVSWCVQFNLSYNMPNKFKTHYVAPQFFIFRRTVWIAPNFLHWNAHIFLFGLILLDIPNSITPQTTLRLLPIPVGLLVLPCTRQYRWPPLTPSLLFFPCPGQRSRRWPVPVPVTGVRYNSWLWLCTLNTLTWPVYNSLSLVGW